MSKKIELGDIAKDPITGIQGVAVCVTKWLHGCNRIGLQPKGIQKDGKPFDITTFDEPQLEMVKKAVVVGSADTGGPRPEPQRRTEPRR